MYPVEEGSVNDPRNSVPISTSLFTPHSSLYLILLSSRTAGIRIESKTRLIERMFQGILNSS